MTKKHMVLAATIAVVMAACGRTEASEAEGAQTDPATAADMDESRAHDADAVVVDATLGSNRYEASGAAECRHAPTASIYGMPAEMWLVQYSGEGDVQSLSLTLWRPASGKPDQLSLSVTADERTSRISTVEGGRMEGSARVALEIDGDGGRLDIEGRDANGDRVSLAVRCPRFAPLEAVGG